MLFRSEEFPAEAVERSGGQDVVQYRQAIMPLLRLSTFFGVDDAQEKSVHQVIVFNHEGGSIGLVVDQILDIVSERITVQRGVKREGVLGSVVLQQRVTDLVDAHTIIRSMGASLGESRAA